MRRVPAVVVSVLLAVCAPAAQAHQRHGPGPRPHAGPGWRCFVTHLEDPVPYVDKDGTTIWTFRKDARWVCWMPPPGWKPARRQRSTTTST